MPRYAVTWTCCLQGTTLVTAENEDDATEIVTQRGWSALGDSVGEVVLDIDCVEEIDDGRDADKKELEV